MWKWESSLVETLTFQSNRKNGTSEEPKFERDLLESRSSFNYRATQPDRAPCSLFHPPSLKFKLCRPAKDTRNLQKLAA
jgi:hypothetical protein